MMRSWPRAMRAPAAILNSNRSVMYPVTRIRKMIKPVMAFREMVDPHVGPTSVSLIWSGLIPAFAASAARRRSPFGVGMPVLNGVGLVPGDAEAGAVGEGVGEDLGLADAFGEWLGDGLTEPDGAGDGDVLAAGTGLVNSPRLVKLSV